jgi:hypothetical protein
MSEEGAAMELTLIATQCWPGEDCPGVYVTDRGTVAVRGDVIDDPEALNALSLPAGEGVVEVPLSLLLETAAQISEKDRR